MRATLAAGQWWPVVAMDLFGFVAVLNGLEATFLGASSKSRAPDWDDPVSSQLRGCVLGCCATIIARIPS